MAGKLSFSNIDDVVRFVVDRGVTVVGLCHLPEDGRLKTLSFAVTGEKRLRQILEFGERVDGSSLFPSFIDPHKSDIYVMPKLETAFTNPFAHVPTLDFMCRYLDEGGQPLDVAPENVLRHAEEHLRVSMDVTLRALAELEFYVIGKQEVEPLFPALPDKNYHESAPFSLFEPLRNEVLVTLAEIGVETKYAHGEVGKVFGKDGTVLEQHEIEFMPQSLVNMAEAIAVTKWVIRNVCQKHGVSATFSPKVSLEHAGNGMHVHLCGLKNSRNILEDAKGHLSVEAKEMIGGLLRFAPSLAAFGNPTPASYLRFLARKESPMSISWGARNRLALVRIPLWWTFKSVEQEADPCKRTLEYRAPDATANAGLLFAGIALAVEYGLRHHEESLKVAEELHLEKPEDRRKPFKRLPISCDEAAKNLRRDRKYYEAEGIFPRSVVEGMVRKLKAYRDGDVAQKIREEPQRAEKLMQTFLHYG